MSASIAPETMHATGKVIAGFFARVSQHQAERVVGLDQSVISRHLTQVHDGQIYHGQRWTAAQLAAMVWHDPQAMGQLIALGPSSAAGCDDQLRMVRDLLQVAQAATDAVAPGSPGGARLTPVERRRLAGEYAQLLAHLAGAIAWLERP